MHGIFTIFRKEMGDHFNSLRFLLISALIVMVGVIITSMIGMAIQEELKGMAKPTLLFLLLFTSTGKLFSFVQFIGFFGPLLGIFLGFDSINRERVSRTLSKLVSQPIFRDSIINAKFLSGAAIIAIILVATVLLISGLGIRLIGVVPGVEEVSRLFIYVIISLLYISFWLGISILFSVVFRSTATSALASLAVWIFFSFFVSLGASVLSDAVAPVSQTASGVDAEMLIRHERVQRVVSSFSPMTLYSDATTTILDPMRKTTRSLILMGPLERFSMSRFQSPLPLLESIFIVIPHLISIVAITLLCFGICYLVFMRQEIRTV
ncbi:MAG: ABC transporter [Deltaproteobacteria bacterium]|nr:ABC transporter [Deltaproteobacteria bacterium]MBM4323715.1 ABC transporter [Deltaproteobacteria bacterium]